MMNVSNVKNSMTSKHNAHNYYGHGKLLLTGEYFVLDGAQALAVPTTVGQSMRVTYTQSYTPKLTWRSYDQNDNMWFEGEYEFWRFSCLGTNDDATSIFLQDILIKARELNKHFLRDEVDVLVETKITFPIEWGLGSSSSLIYNIAQWAYVSPFALLANTTGGSGYDLACAQSDGPILYQTAEEGPSWKIIDFNPRFKDNIFFVYTGRKQDSREAIQYYNTNGPYPPEDIMAMSRLTREMVRAESIEEFEFVIAAHENMVSRNLKYPKVKDRLFPDYWGEVKSLGAWGGDFVMVTTNRDPHETREYFMSKGLDIFIPYRELILKSDHDDYSHDILQ